MDTGIDGVPLVKDGNIDGEPSKFLCGTCLGAAIY